ncbi:uncharacterized protein N7483_002096 [Penicillium malachiteum]|uniref:uncharacterized protein n=1 Tax=Penicillium malachiteum TaxID=1324776 RepID=UPI002548E7B2|nr:uncharacterized protein N7483_002096 [Penicillium malachiteum]KAJ5736971.1 hypothetical protein N7483_002096 [Penicillium malachiteum]
MSSKFESDVELPAEMELDSDDRSTPDGAITSLTLTPKRLRRWNSYFNELVEIARELKFGIMVSDDGKVKREHDPDNTDGPVTHELHKTLYNTEKLERKLRAEVQRDIAHRYSIFSPCLGLDIFCSLLDRIVGCEIEIESPNPNLLQRDIHLIHILESASDVANYCVAEWMKCPHVLQAFDSYIRAFPDYEKASAEFTNRLQHWKGATIQDLDTNDLDWQLGMGRGLAHGLTSLAFDCASNCAHCLDFLIRHDIIKLQGYDGYGFNWVEAAIRAKNPAVLTYLLEKMSEDEFFNYTNVHHIRLNNHRFTAKMAVLRLVTRTNWEWACELLIKKLIKDRKGKKMAEYVDNPTRALLNRFLSPEIAEKLRKNKFSIANICKRELCEEKTAWHIAALYNPHGDAYMTWLLVNSSHEVAEKNFKGKDTLHIAAAGNNPACIRWLCGQLDPLKVWDRPTDMKSGSKSALLNEYAGCALELAARNMTNLSVFETMVDCVEDEAFEEFELTGYLFKAICYGLRDYMENPAPDSRLSVTQATDIAKSKCEIIMERLPDKWIGSPTFDEVLAIASQCGFVDIAGRMVHFSESIKARAAARPRRTR